MSPYRRNIVFCPTSALVRQTERLEERTLSGSSVVCASKREKVPSNARNLLYCVKTSLAAKEIPSPQASDS